MRILFIAIAVLMLVWTWRALRKEPSVIHSVRLGFWLTMLAWMLTRINALSYLAGGLLGLSVLSWIAPHLFSSGRRRARPLRRGAPDIAEELGQLRSTLDALPLGKRIAKLPEDEVYPYLRHKDTAVRRAAAERLRKVATPPNAERLIERLHGTLREPDDIVRLKLALALAKFKRPEALPELSAALDPHRAGRWDALDALVKLEARQYIPEMVLLAAQEPKSIGTANAIHAIMRLGGGEQLLEPRSRNLLIRYVRGAPHVLPGAIKDVGAIAELFHSSNDPELHELAGRLDRLLQYTEVSEAKIRAGWPDSPPSDDDETRK
jgi:hypothetical protein